MGLRSKRCSHTSWLGRRRDRFRPSRFLTGLTHSPCHQGQLPIGIVGGGYQPYCRSVLAVVKSLLVGISREWEPRGRLATGNCNHSNLTQSSSRQGRWASALRPMLIGTMGGRFRAKGGSPFACLPSLIGVASERYARRPIGEVAQSPSHQSPYASAVRPKLVSAIGNGYRPYGRSSFPLRTSLIGVNC